MSSRRLTHDPSLRLIPATGADALPDILRVVLAGLPECDAASIAILREGSPLNVVASRLTIRWLTELQYRGTAGPCWEATVSNRTVAVPDLAALDAEDDWLALARRNGLTAAMAIPVPTAEDTAAVLGVYTRAAPGWTWSVAATATWFAAFVGHCLAGLKPPAGTAW